MSNVRQGDLAIVVAPTNPANAGRIVKVVRLAVAGEKVSGYRWLPRSGGLAWVCEGRNLHTGNPSAAGGLSAWVFNDRSLRPIRPGDITDEEVRELFAPPVPGSMKETA